MKAHNNYDPLGDGIDHINIYSQGQTLLGKYLSNFAHTPFAIGNLVFQSVESWWFYKKMRNIEDAGEYEYTAYQYEIVRDLVGHEAKLYFYRITPDADDSFNPTPEQVKAIFLKKLAYNLEIQTLLQESELPFAHYYYKYGIKTNVDKYLYMADLWQEIRTKLKTDGTERSTVVENS